MRVRRTSGAVVAAVALATLAAACGSSNGGGKNNAGGGPKADNVLKLGYVLPETGKLAYLGPPQIEAAKYAVSLINAAGGVNGQQIPQLVGGDEGDQTAQAVQSAQQVLNSNVDALIGAAASGQTLAIIDKVTGAHVVECSGSNTTPTLTNYKDGGYYIRTAPSDALQGPVLGNLVVQDGHSNVAIVYRSDDYGKGLAGATKKAIEGSGGSVPVNQGYDPNATDFSGLVSTVKAANPDAVVVIGFEEGAQVLKTLIENGLSPKNNVGLYGADGLRNTDLAKLVDPSSPGSLDGMKGTAPASADNPTFVSNLKKFAPSLTQLQFAPQVFDCVNVVALAAQEAKSNDPTKFKDHLVDVTKDGTKCTSFADCKKLLDQGKNIDYDGASGPLDFTSPGEPGQATIEIYGFSNGGQFKSVTTVQSKPANS